MDNVITKPGVGYSQMVGYLPLVSYLQWDLGAETEYSAGDTLSFTLTMQNAQTTARWLYIVGGLLAKDTQQWISGSDLSIKWDAGLGYAYNVPVPGTISVFKVNAQSQIQVPCRFQLAQSDAYLALVMVEMAGDEPAVDDPARGQVATLLTTPAGLNLMNVVLPLMVVMMMMGMILPMMTRSD